MNCPVCKADSLNTREIEPNLFAEVCRNCNGKWISSDNYEKWLNQLGETLPELPVTEDSGMTIPEFELARLCPKDRRILIKYKVGRNLPFKIDRCSNCAGVWLDDKEWIALKERNLHDELNKVFTDHWQEEVKKEETRKTLEGIYRDKFGVEDYTKIKDFKIWIEKHEKGGEILAFLRDKNPLQF
jgi:Zn-finger nucleic acid-binding protein